MLDTETLVFKFGKKNQSKANPLSAKLTYILFDFLQISPRPFLSFVIKNKESLQVASPVVLVLLLGKYVIFVFDRWLTVPCKPLVIKTQRTHSSWPFTRKTARLRTR